MVHHLGWDSEGAGSQWNNHCCPSSVFPAQQLDVSVHRARLHRPAQAARSSVSHKAWVIIMKPFPTGSISGSNKRHKLCAVCVFPEQLAIQICINGSKCYSETDETEAQRVCKKLKKVRAYWGTIEICLIRALIWCVLSEWTTQFNTCNSEMGSGWRHTHVMHGVQ